LELIAPKPTLKPRIHGQQCRDYFVYRSTHVRAIEVTRECLVSGCPLVAAQKDASDQDKVVTPPAYVSLKTATV
jgi:hypothetical protein